MNRRGVELSVNVLIIAAIALIVLVILVYLVGDVVEQRMAVPLEPIAVEPTPEEQGWVRCSSLGGDSQFLPWVVEIRGFDGVAYCRFGDDDSATDHYSPLDDWGMQP